MIFAFSLLVPRELILLMGISKDFCDHSLHCEFETMDLKVILLVKYTLYLYVAHNECYIKEYF